jgi:hypothetical protein
MGELNEILSGAGEISSESINSDFSSTHPDNEPTIIISEKKNAIFIIQPSF